MRIKQEIRTILIKLKQKIKDFFIGMKALLKLRPLIFVTALFSLGYGAVTVIIGSIKLSYFIGVTGACALIFAVTKLYALKKYNAALLPDAQKTKSNSAQMTGRAEKAVSGGTQKSVGIKTNSYSEPMSDNAIKSKSYLKPTVDYTIKTNSYSEPMPDNAIKTKNGAAQNSGFGGDTKQPACLTESGKGKQGCDIDSTNMFARNMAISASVMSFLHFSIAVVCTFFEEENPSNYGFWFIIFVAGAAFLKVLLSTINAIRTKKNHNLIIHHIKLIDNANALIALGLTQRAILYYVGNDAARLISGVGGMFFSFCALFVCLTMFMKYKYASKGTKEDKILPS